MVDYPVHDFELDFSTDKWSHVSAYDSKINKTNPPFPQSIHRLWSDIDKNWLIRFDLRSGGQLLVPCLEFFSRCYGRSQELNKILATFPWKGSSEAHQSQLYAPLDEPEEPNKWKIKLRKRLTNGDTVFLAHAKYDPYTESAAKSIYSQIESKYTPERPLTFVKVPPWFQGPAEIRARGIWFNNNRSFLALRIIGSSDPDGIVIIRERDNTKNREGVDPRAYGEAWKGAVKKKLIRPPDIVDITGDLEPDRDASRVEILDEDFIVMGVPRRVVDRHGKKITHDSGIQKNGTSASTFSSSDPHGSGKGVGHATIHANPVMESHGTLMEMWDTVRHLQKTNSKSIQSVEWFTFEDGYKSTDMPKLIALDPNDAFAGINVPTETMHWPYYKVAGSIVRGVLVIRMMVYGKFVHIIEIQRRHRTKDDGHGNVYTGEEPLQGVILLFNGGSESIQFMRRFMCDVCYVRGIVKKLKHSFDNGDTYVHSPKEYMPSPFDAVVRKALTKVGIKL